MLDRFGSLEPADIAGADPDEFAALCATPPAVHRFPGFGRQKAQIFTALLGKLQVAPTGWERAAGDYAAAGSHRSVADVVDAASLEQVRAFKKQKKAASR